MSRTNKNEKVATVAATAQERARVAAAKVKPAAAQVKPLATSTREAAGRGLRRTRVWAAPRIEHAGQILQDSVAPKVSAALSSAARKIEPTEPRQRRWRLLSGISVLLTAAAGAVAAMARKRKTTGDTAPAAETGPGLSTASEQDTSADAQAR